MPSNGQTNPWRSAGAGLELVGVVAVLAALGYAFDRWQGTTPWGVLVGSLVAIVGGLYKLVRDAVRAGRMMGANRERESKRNPSE